MQQVDSQFVKSASGWPRACYGVDLSNSEPMVVLAEKKHGKVVWRKVTINNTTLAKAVDTQTVTSGCVSARDSLTRRLEAPFSSRSKVVRVLPTLLDIQLPFSLEDCQYEFLDFRKTDFGTMESLAVAATKDNINKKIESIKKVGFDPEIIDIEGLAVWSQIQHEFFGGQTSDIDSLTAVLILNGELSSLTIGRGRRFLNSYGLNANDTKRVLRLVKAYLLNQGERISWFIAGNGATDKDLVSHWQRTLSEQSYREVEVVDDPESFLARALAVRALCVEYLHCNLRNGNLTHNRIYSYGSGVKLKLAVLLGVVGALLCLGNIVLQHNISTRNDEIKKEFKGMVDSLTGYHVAAMGKAAVKIANDSIVERKAGLKPFLQAFKPSLLNVITDIADVAKNNNLQCNNLLLDFERISISGMAEEFKASDELVKVAVRAGYVVSNKRGSAIANNKIPFTITTEPQL